MTAADILREGRKLIENPENWVQGSFGQTKGGNRCYAVDPRANCWCAVGAISKVGEEVAEDEWQLAWVALDNASPCGCSIRFNDHAKTTHADVLAMFDRAIATVTGG